MDIESRLTNFVGIGVEGFIDDVEISANLFDVEGAISAAGGAILGVDRRLTYISDFGIGLEGATDDVEGVIVDDVEGNECTPDPLLIFVLLRFCITKYSAIGVNL